MRCFILSLLIPLSSFSFGQTHTSMSEADSVKLSEAWTKYLNALISNDYHQVKKLSVKSIFCLTCSTEENYNSYVDAKTFTGYFASALHINSINTGKKKFFVYDFRNDPAWTGSKYMTIYNIGFEGTDTVEAFGKYIPLQYIHIYQFVKVKQNFLFYGFDVLP